MKKDDSKRQRLISAILSRDKNQLRKALQVSKPEKWICVELDYDLKIMKYLNKPISEAEMKAILEEAEKDFSLKLIVMRFNNFKDGTREEKWFFLDGIDKGQDCFDITLKL